jgi:hypothetical protein
MTFVFAAARSFGRDVQDREMQENAAGTAKLSIIAWLGVFT